MGLFPAARLFGPDIVVIVRMKSSLRGSTASSRRAEFPKCLSGESLGCQARAGYPHDHKGFQISGSWPLHKAQAATGEFFDSAGVSMSTSNR